MHNDKEYITSLNKRPLPGYEEGLFDSLELAMRKRVSGTNFPRDLVMQLRFGEVDSRVYHAYPPLKRDLDPNEVNSLRYLYQNAKKMCTSTQLINQRIRRYRERGVYWNPLQLFLELAGKIPELKKYVARIQSVSGRRTLVIKIRGVFEGYVILHVFELYYNICTGVDPIILEFGLTQYSQERVRDLFGKTLSPSVDFDLIFLTIMLAKFSDIPVDDRELPKLPHGLPSEVTSKEHVDSRYINYAVPADLKNWANLESHVTRNRKWAGSKFESYRGRQELVPLSYFAVMAAELEDAPKVIAEMEKLEERYSSLILEPTPQLPSFSDVELIEKIPIPGAEKVIHFGFIERAPLGAHPLRRISARTPPDAPYLPRATPSSSRL